MAVTESKGWNVVFVLGPPGCGKGTQCKNISQQFGYIHLSAGDLLRAERSREGSQFGKLIDEHIKNGTIVPVEITCKLLENAMIASGGAPGFLIDGFPRNKDNLDGWVREMDTKTKLRFVLFLECAQDICVERCLSRGQGRTDDNEDSLKKRIATYHNQTMPIIDHYRKEDVVRKIDAAKTPNMVFEEVKEIFNS